MAEVNVLIPVDLAENRKATLNFGIHGAKRWGWSLHVLHIFTGHNASEEVMQDILTKIHQEYPAITIDGESIHGDAVEIISEKSASAAYALVLLEANDTSVWGYRLTGEQSFDLADRCAIPIFTIPMNYTIEKFGRLGVLTGFEKAEFESFRLLVNLFDHSMEWVMFHVFRDKDEEADLFIRLKEWELDVRGNIDQSAIKFLLEENEDVKAGIANILLREELDILVVTSVYKGFFRRLFSKDYFRELLVHPPLRPTLYIKCKTLYIKCN